MQTPGVCLILVALCAMSGATVTSDVADLIQRGQILQRQGRFIEAEQQFQAAVHNATATPHPPDTQAAALANLANVEIDLDHMDSAARLYNRGIKILRNGNSASMLLAEDLSLRLAELYLEAGETDTAGILVDHVIASQEASQTAPRWANAFAYDLRAGVYASRKKLAAAEQAERKAGSARESEWHRILSRFSEDDEFGLPGSHSLGLQQKVAKVFITAAAAKQ
jgi:Tfp pilus assembly protein PilF